ncbi:hypothetical protein ACH3XW_3765 [Acanthocheilonema viteae]|nr:unnamed protein product [Acanthocheilonema viteae]VBB31276.1 unnamed protein product [Acanthocheilonema viteae]
MYLVDYRQQMYPPVLQPYNIERQPYNLGLQPYNLGLQPYNLGLQPYNLGQQSIRQIQPPGRPWQYIQPSLPSAVQPEYVQPKVIDKTCDGCIITVNCGGKDCLPTKQSTIWIPPTREPIRLTLPPAPKAAWTFETRTTQTPKPTSRECRMCPCYAPQQCQMCPSCK